MSFIDNFLHVSAVYTIRINYSWNSADETKQPYVIDYSVSSVISGCNRKWIGSLNNYRDTSVISIVDVLHKAAREVACLTNKGQLNVYIYNSCFKSLKCGNFLCNF